MQQLAWVAPRAVRHEAVIEEVMAYSPVLPLPFGTLFSSAEALSQFVDPHRETIARFLLRVADHGEWSVKGWLDRKQALAGLTSTRLTAEQNRLSALPPGTRHFAEQRIARDIERGLGLWLDETSRTVASDLTSYASDFRECALAPCAHPESGAEEVLNWAFLLPEAALARVSRARATGQPGLPAAGTGAATFRPVAAVSFCPGFVLDRRPMKYLLYCIFRSVPQPERGSPHRRRRQASFGYRPWRPGRCHL